METRMIVNAEELIVASAVSLSVAHGYFSLQRKGLWVKPIPVI